MKRTKAGRRLMRFAQALTFSAALMVATPVVAGASPADRQTESAAPVQAQAVYWRAVGHYPTLTQCRSEGEWWLSIGAIDYRCDVAPAPPSVYYVLSVLADWQ